MTTVDTSPAPSGAAERIPLSFNQEFLCLFDKGDDEGPFGPTYNIVCGWRLSGEVDVDILRGALDDLVERHEALRTVIVRGDERHQSVRPPGPAQLIVRDLPGVEPDARHRRAEELLIELETGSYSARELPLIRAVLGRFDDDDAVLALVAHHSAVDEWSMKVVIRDLAALYAARKGYDLPELPEAIQYREYAVWDRGRSDSPAMEKAREYWRRKVRGAQIVPMRTDHLRSEGLPKGTAAYRFLIEPELTSATLDVARTTRSSPFMVLLAAYQVFLRELAGATDITVTAFTSGRGQARFHQTIGSFFNLVPLRTDLAGCATFRDVVARTRTTCLQAYTHDIPFGQLVAETPEIAGSFVGDDTCVFTFQVFQFPFLMDHEAIGDLEYSDIRRRLLSQPETTDIPDGGLWTLDIDPIAGDMVGSLWFNTNLFDESTIHDMVSEFRRVLRTTVAAPDTPLKQI